MRTFLPFNQLKFDSKKLMQLFAFYIYNKMLL